MNILWVDDDQDFLFLMSKLLKHRGHAVKTANSPFGVSAAVTSSALDMVVLDVEMPGLDGVALAKLIAKLDLPAPPKVVLCSATDADRLRRAGRDAGVPTVAKGVPSQIIAYIERLAIGAV
jgi:CheY-like chemotaxis protein